MIDLISSLSASASVCVHSSSGKGADGPLTAPQWLTAADAFDASLSQLELDLTEPSITQRQRRTLQRRLTEAKDEISRLDSTLRTHEANPMQHKIGSGEAQRRREKMTQLKAKLASLSADEENAHGRRRGTARSAMAVSDTEETAALSNSQLYAAQRATIAQQDEKLDNILAGVHTLKAISSDIHSELDVHNGLLTDLDAQMDHTDNKLRANTRKIAVIERRTRGWLSVCCMVGWIVLLVLLLATDVFCPFFALMGSHCNGHNASSNNNVATSSLGRAAGDGGPFGGVSKAWLGG